MLRRLWALFPVLAAGSVMVSRAFYFWWRPGPTVTGTSPIPGWFPWAFFIGGVTILVLTVLRTMVVPIKWWSLIAAPMTAPYVWYGVWLVENRHTWQWAGILGEFLLIPIMVSWAWGNEPVKELSNGP